MEAEENSQRVQIPIDLESTKVSDFLDYFRVQVQFAGGWQGEGSLGEDGRFQEKVVGRLKGSQPEHGELRIELNWNTDGTLEPMEFEFQGQPYPNWQAVVQGWVHDSLVSAVNADLETHFFNHRFAYVGAPLDGEYYISGVRIAPAIHPDESMLLDERIVYVGLHAEGVDLDQAQGVAKIRGERFVSLLSCFTSIGFYAIPVERRWVLNGRGGSDRRQLGFRPDLPPPTEMPRKGQLCPLGSPVKMNREELLAPMTDQVLRLPADIRLLFRRFDDLEPNEHEAFLGAAGLYRVALTAGRSFPSVRMAYQIAAVDALLRKEPDKKRAFIELVTKLCPEADEGFAAEMYGRIRSGHFHAGRFPGGEYEPLEFGPFAGPGQLRRLNFQHAVQLITWNTLIRWLLSPDRESS